MSGRMYAYGESSRWLTVNMRAGACLESSEGHLIAKSGVTIDLV